MKKFKTLADVTTTETTRPRLQMSDSEILSNYNRAKNKTEQIGILADLNVTNKDIIRAILIDNGCILDEKKKPAPKPGRGSPWTDEEDTKLLQMKQAGKSYIDISHELGRTIDTVRWRGSVLRKRHPDSTISVPIPVPADPEETITPKNEPITQSDNSTSIQPDILPKIRYALTLCCDASNAFGNDKLIWGGIALGELKQVLSTLKNKLEKESSR